MEENKTKRPIFLSMPVIILVSICTLTILAPVSLIMSLIRFKKYPELKNKNITCLGISIIMIIALIMFANMPDGGKEIQTSEVETEEVTKIEEPTTEAVTEPETTEAKTEEKEDTGLFGYPEQEQELMDAGIMVGNIPSRECFLYTYAEYKVLTDYTDVKNIDDVWEWVNNNTSDSYETDYEAIDSMVYSYSAANLANYIPDYLVPLVGDECNSVIDAAMATYYGYTPDDASESVTSINSVAITYIEALEKEDSYNLTIVNHGTKTKEEIYSAASEIASNISSTQFNNYSKDFIRDLDNNVGQPIVYSGSVASVINNYAEVMYIPDYYGEGETSTVDVDLSCLTDTTLLQQDNVTIYGVYLGLNGSNKAVILALSITIN